MSNVFLTPNPTDPFGQIITGFSPSFMTGAQPAAPYESATTFWGAAPPPASTYGWQIPGYQYAYGTGGIPGGKTQRLPQSDVPQTQNVGNLLTPNLPTWLIPIAGAVAVILLVNWFPSLYNSVVIGLVGIILLWLTQPTR